MMTRRWILTAVTGAVCALMLTACGSDKAMSPSPSGTVQANANANSTSADASASGKLSVQQDITAKGASPKVSHHQKVQAQSTVNALVSAVGQLN